MPTIDRFGPYRVHFYSDETGEPRHVHVRRDDKMLKIWLNDLVIALNRGFSDKEMGVILNHVEQKRDEYINAWDYFFRTEQ